MFGYVIPCKEKLDEQSWQSYRAAYCGLCHTLKRRYGPMASLLLNYDFTFLAFLLRREASQPCTKCMRCVSAPVKGRDACLPDPGLEAAADCSVLLVYWKLRDQRQDEKGFKRLAARLLLLLFGRTFRRARARSPELNREISERLKALQELEFAGCTSIDRTADQFARLMTAMVPPDWDELSRRALWQLLYHLGRWIYLIDAWDDLKDDVSRRRYNPIAARFGLTGAGLEGEGLNEAKEAMERTIGHSEHLAISAFHLADFGASAPIIENVLCAGLQTVRHLVFSGEWKKKRRLKKQELNRV